VNKILMLTVSNIKKTIGHTISLFIMFLIAALLLNSGLLISINFNKFFNDTCNELNTSNIYYTMPSRIYDDELRQYIRDHENLISMQEEYSIWADVKVKYNDEERGLTLLMNDASFNRDLSKWKFVGEHLPVESDEMSIYLPSIFRESGNYNLNDNFLIHLPANNKKLDFTIKGFIEDIYFSSMETRALGIYLPHDTFVMVSDLLGESHDAVLIYANLKEINKDIEIGIKELTGLEATTYSSNLSNLLLSFDIEIIETSRVLMAFIMAVMVIAFAFIIVAVCLIVVRFRISNSIEEDMAKIGSLKAIGYTSRQIILSIVLQFVLIALTASILGIILSYMTTPIISDVFAQQSGIKWIQGFDLYISTMSLGLIIIIVMLIAYISSRKIKRLNPIVALRGGIITHNFKKNHLPLEHSRGNISFFLAIKNLLQNKKQGIMITIIMFAVSFTGVFAVVMFYNTTVDTKAFNETPGIELSNVVLSLKTDTDHDRIKEEVINMEGVRKAQYIDDVMVVVNKYEVRAFVMEDYGAKETDTIYEGRYPKHANEIAIAGHLAKMLNKDIGDSISVEYSGVKEDYLITGFTQGTFMGGINASIRRDGFIKINPNYKEQSLQIYLDKDYDAGILSKKLEGLYKEEKLAITDMDYEIGVGAGVYTDIVSKVGITILVVTIAVVILVLYFVINSSIIRRKRELGIQKAIGYTTYQLMNQISMGLLPSTIIGVVIGCLVSATKSNAIMSLVQRGMGIMKANYVVVPLWIIEFAILLIVVSYITSILLTYRVRKISAYALITE
jgi:putative ABC transport system permease protein